MGTTSPLPRFNIKNKGVVKGIRKSALFFILLLMMFPGQQLMISPSVQAEQTNKTFRVWVLTDTHAGGSSYGINNTEVLKDALRDSENDWGFDWDIALILGDLTENSTETEYKDFINTFKVLTRHRREDFFIIPGNHDTDAAIDIYKQYIDPLGRNGYYSGMDNAYRAFYLENVSDDLNGYTIRVGNTLFVLMSPTWSNNNYYKYSWWDSIVSNTPSDMNILCFSHHYLFDSGIFSLAYRPIRNSGLFSSWLQDHPGRIDAWLSGHIHWDYNLPDTTYVSSNWGTTFIDAASL